MRPASVSRPWALMAYTIADDTSGGGSLDSSVKEELAAIYEAADFGDVHIATQVDFKRTPGVYRASLTSLQAAAATLAGHEFEDVQPADHVLWRNIQRGVRRSSLRVQMGQTDLNSARVRVLEKFLRFGQQACPADRYVAFFYGHAAGPMGLFFDKDDRKSAAETSLGLDELARAFTAANGRAAVLVFRDCYMNTLETACELRGSGEYMIASQSEMPIAGIWPWLPLMTTLIPGGAPRDVGRALAVQLGSFLDVEANRGKFVDAPISLVDLGAADTIVEPLKALADALEESRQDPARCRACAEALDESRVGYPDQPSVQPGDPALIDVPTFCEKLAALPSDPVAGPAAALADAVRSRLIVWHHAQKKHFRGVSLYYKPVKPKDGDRSVIQDRIEPSYYKKLGLNAATGWHRIALNPLKAKSE